MQKREANPSSSEKCTPTSFWARQTADRVSGKVFHPITHKSLHLPQLLFFRPLTLIIIFSLSSSSQLAVFCLTLSPKERSSSYIQHMVKQGSNPRTYGSIIMSGRAGRPKEEDGELSKLMVGGGDGASATSTPQNLSSWLPSPHSTSRSSRENLDLLLKQSSSVDTNGTEDSALLLVAAGECDTGGSGGSVGKTLEPSFASRLARLLCSRRRIVLVGLGLLVASVYVFGRYYAHHHQHPTMIPSGVTGGGGENDFADDDNDDDGATTIPTKRQKTMAALSKLDPVTDLHLFAYERPDGSKPPSALTASTYTVYPTNSWYQNLLMVNDQDGPQDIHRVYCIPYIVDAAGKIAGLRLHGVHRTVSNTVIQLNTQNEFGLTIGAVSSFTSDDNEKQSLSRGYTIDTTTPLGVTLQWVSSFFRARQLS
jgi:hypothetical protein